MDEIIDFLKESLNLSNYAKGDYIMVTILALKMGSAGALSKMGV